MKDVTVAVWQFEPLPGHVPKNLAALGQALDEARCLDAELVVAPEQFITGWLPGRTDHAVAMDSDVIRRLGAAARNEGVWLATSVLVAHGSRRRNRFVLFDDQGNVATTYDKIHLWESENETTEPGDRVSTSRTPWGTVGGLVCYDMEFPELAKDLATQGVDLLLCPSAFYTPQTWVEASSARARENGVFLAAANQVGGQGERPHNGQSRIVGPRGDVLAEVKGDGNGVSAARLDASVLAALRTPTG